MLKRLVVSFLQQRRGSSSSVGGTPSTQSVPPASPQFVGVLSQVEPVTVKNKRVSQTTTTSQSSTSTLQHQQHHHHQQSIKVRDRSYSALLSGIWGGVLTGIDADDLGLRRVLSSGDGGMMRGVATKVAQSINQSSSQSQSHPFMATAGELFFGSSLDVVTPGALVLLLERALLQQQHQQHHSNSAACVSLARAVVKTCGGYLIHRTVGEGLSDGVHQGNKLATLTGDLLVISLIKDVAETKSNKVLELTMESLSEFSVGEVAGRRAFFETPESFLFDASSGCDLAESWVVSRGLESVGVLSSSNSGQRDSLLLLWLSELGSGLGTLWKVHYDLVGVVSGGGSVGNRREMGVFAQSVGGDLKERVLRRGVEMGFIRGDDCCPAVGAVRSLVDFWVGSIVVGGGGEEED